jgi:hypothetical protein
VPRTPKQPPIFNSPAGKGNSLSTFINYLLCGGQAHVDQLGYSPLPVNLVRGGFLQDSFIPGHGSIPSLSTLPSCHNPTFVHGQDLLVKDAPFPSPCDKVTAPLDCVVRHGKGVAPGGGHGKSGNGPSAGPSGGGHSTGRAATTATGGAAARPAAPRDCRARPPTGS